MNRFSTMSFVIISSFLFSCSGKKAEKQIEDTEVVVEVPTYPMTVPFETGIETEREVLLSEIADSVRLIPLETNDKSLIRGIKDANILKTDKYLFLPWVETLFQYTVDGKFVRTLGRKGGGPGEFNWIAQIDIDEEKGLVFMLTTSLRINVYDMESGKFLRSMKTPDIESADFAMLDDTTSVTFVRNTNGKRKVRLYVADVKGDTLNMFTRSDLFELNSQYSWMMSSSTDRYMFHYEDMVCCKDYYNDTLFTVTRNLLEPRYIFEMGKYSLPIECRFEYLDGDGKRFQELAAPYIKYQAIETDSYVFMPYTNWAGEKARKQQLAMFDKKTEECYKVSGDGFISNDLGSELPVSPVSALDSKTLLCVWEVQDIFKAAEKNPAILELEQLKGIDEDDNPVLMIVYLK